MQCNVRYCKKKKKRRDRYDVRLLFDFLKGALYFGWPNQPSSGTMGILLRDHDICIIPKIRKTKVIFKG